MTLEDAASRLESQFQIISRTDFRGEVTLELTLAQIESACRFAKEQLGFDFLADLSSVDNFGDEPRFEVVYELYSLSSNVHLRLKTRVSEDHLEVPSVVQIWATANWRRILMWEGYPYYPLRKDFPLEGQPSEMPDVAFSEPAPLAGGPFVSIPGPPHIADREPRAQHVGDD